MITVIEKLDGTRINLFDSGILTLDFVVSPIDLVFDSESIRGRPGRIRTRNDYGNRLVMLKLLALANDKGDIPLIRDELASIIDGKDPFYIYESVTPRLYGFEVPGQTQYKSAYDSADTYIIESKRLLIQRSGNESLKFNGPTGKRSIDFETYALPFWESSKTTSELSNPSWDVGTWAWGMGLKWDESYSWKYRSSSFTVHNLGNVDVDPKHMPFKIKIKGRFPNGFILRNLTTGAIFTCTQAVNTGDEFVLDGVNYLLNNVNVAAQTNYGLITLKPGENQIQMSGPNGVVESVEFDFRFYFK